MDKKTLQAIKKMAPEELQRHIHMRKRGKIQKNKKAYSRKKKHKDKVEE